MAMRTVKERETWALIERPPHRLAFATTTGELLWEPDVLLFAKIGDWYIVYEGDDRIQSEVQVVNLGVKTTLLERSRIPRVTGYRPTIFSARFASAAQEDIWKELVSRVPGLAERRARCALLVPDEPFPRSDGWRAVVDACQKAEVRDPAGQGGPRPPNSSGVVEVSAAPAADGSLDLKGEDADQRGGAEKGLWLADAQRRLHEKGHLDFMLWALTPPQPGHWFERHGWLSAAAREELQALLVRYQGLYATWTLDLDLTRQLARPHFEVLIHGFRSPLPSVFLRIPDQGGDPSSATGVHVMESQEKMGALECVFVEALDVPPFYRLTRTVLRADVSVPDSDFPKRLDAAWWCMRHLMIAVSRPPRPSQADRPKRRNLDEHPNRLVVKHPPSWRKKPPREIPVDPWHLELSAAQIVRLGGSWRWTEAFWEEVRSRRPMRGTWVRGHYALRWVRKENAQSDEEVIYIYAHLVAVYRWREAHTRGHGAVDEMDYRSGAQLSGPERAALIGKGR